MTIQRCAHCIGGSVLFGACIACGREVHPNLVTFREAMATLGTPEAEPYCGPRQQVPLAVSPERARRWTNGGRA